ncbi:MAG: EF-hand domain-containing protein, partial [Bacteroidota bacterium]
AQSNDGERPRRQRPSIDQLFKDLDTDEDGKLSKEEVRGPLSKHFADIDTDEDGYLTREELENAPKPEGKGRPNKR